MSELLSEESAYCPFCGEPISLLIDISAGSQSYIEDCQVCCRPMEVHIETDGAELLGLTVNSAA